uniref:Reverse transcriptase zinc-binding domain-containing protein n=1 Tax=Picea glauca TaxID=3330 RepID=A0A101LTM3_PICGL|nr:hypothetical protein ABT39_MTgene3632 [Picea glauca]
MILGLGDRSILSPSLRHHLLTLNISVLAQVRVSIGESPLPDTWTGNNDLSLRELIATEWNRYTYALKSVGVALTVDPDVLLWADGDATGSIIVKNIYAALQQQHNSGVEIPWIQQLWNWKVPLKLKLFTWLIGKERILTWDAFQRRGWEGPGICLLCNNAPEDLQHLLVHCPFTKEVWYRSIKHFSLPIAWCGSTISDCFSLWSTQKSAPPRLAVHIC